MRHSVPAPSFPPDPDDLFKPPAHQCVGEMPTVVWSVMRLTSNTDDFAWCTVCRKWYRYRSDMNASYIKSLFRHCKTQHFIGDDGILKSASASFATNTNHAYQSSTSPMTNSERTNIAQVNPVTNFDQNATTPQPQTNTPPRSTTLHYFPNHDPSSSVAARPSQPVPLQYPLAPVSSDLRHSQPKQQPSNSPSPSYLLQLKIAEQQQQLRQRMQNYLYSTLPLEPVSQLPPQAPPPPLPPSQLRHYSDTSTSNLPPPLGEPLTSQMPFAAATKDSEARVPFDPAMGQSTSDPRYSVPGLMQGTSNNFTHTDERNFNLQKQAVLQELYASIGKYPATPNHNISNSHHQPDITTTDTTLSSHPAPARPTQNQSFTYPASNVSLPPPAVPPQTLLKPAQTPNFSMSTTPIQVGSSIVSPPASQNMAPSPFPILPTGRVTVRKSSSPNGPRKALGTRAAYIPAPAATSAPMPAPVSMPASAAIPAPPLTPDGVKSGTHCKITKAVRDVADKIQQSLYRGSNIFFTKAVFHVPTSVEEAFDIMKTGVFDVDKETDPNNTLYFISWAHTQFFAAQMAALGFRFKTCNLKRRAGQVTLPPVEQWLRLERPDPVVPTDPAPGTLAPPATTPAASAGSTLTTNPTAAAVSAPVTVSVPVPAFDPALGPTPVHDQQASGPGSAPNPSTNPLNLPNSNMSVGSAAHSTSAQLPTLSNAHVQDHAPTEGATPTVGAQLSQPPANQVTQPGITRGMEVIDLT